MAELEIRPLRAEDRAGWQPLFEAYRHFYRAPDPAVADAVFDRLVEQRDGMYALVAVQGGEIVGITHCVMHASTWHATATYLEDLFVRPAHRRKGYGRSLLVHLAQIAERRGCGRFEWSVLDWNADAIAVYRKLGAVGMEDWTIQRLTGDALVKLAGR